MNTLIVASGVFILIVFIAIIQARTRGKLGERLKQAEADKEAMRDYETIDSRPDVSNPLGRMRKKDK